MAKYYIYILLSLFCFKAIGQPDPSSNWKKNQKIALEFLAESDFQNAAKFFSLAADGTTGTPAKGLYLNAASCYEKVGNFWHARNAYKTILDNSDWDGEIVYKYSNCQYRLGNYKDALSNFKNVLSTIQGEYLQDKKQEIKNSIAGCELALAMQSNNVTLFELTPLNTSISSYEKEFNPIINADNMLRYSRMENGLSKMYFGNYIDGAWSSVNSDLRKALPEKFNGSFSVAPSGERVYYSSCTKRNDGSLKCSIYQRQLKNGSWSTPEKLPETINKTNSSNLHPYVYEERNKEVLLFCSDRTDGEGGTDIWFSIRSGGDKSMNFSEPQNLGIKINTTGDETTPFYDSDKGILYFSSNGHTNVGGFDVFKVRGAKNSWDRPQNMGFPINSSADDLYFNYLPSKNIGFLVSNRTKTESEAQNNDDIYALLSLSGLVKIYGNITDEKGNRLKDVDISIADMDGSAPESSNHFSTGQYSINLEENHSYKITVSKSDYEPQDLEITAFKFNGVHEIKQDVTLAFNGSGDPMIAMVDKEETNAEEDDERRKAAERAVKMELEEQQRIALAKKTEAARVAAELKAKEEADRIAAAKAAKLAEEQRLAAIEAKKAEAAAKLKAEQEAEAARVAAELKAKEEADRIAAAKAAKLAEEQRLAAIEAKKAEVAAKLKAEQEAARVAAELKAKEEAEKLAEENAKLSEELSAKVAPHENESKSVEQITDSKGKYKVRTYEEIISDIKKNKEKYNKQNTEKENREDADYEESNDWR